MSSKLFSTISNNKYVVFTPSANSRVVAFCDKQESNIWLSSDINLTHDAFQWNLMTMPEQQYIKQILAYFAASDGLVAENIVLNFVEKIQVPEIRYFYYMQMMMEGVHSKTYSQLINTFIPTNAERDILFNSLSNHPVISKKGKWAQKWMDKENNFFERMIAFMAIEGIMFAGSFASIFWLRDRGILANSLGTANEYISRDETLHAEFAAFIVNEYGGEEKPSVEKITEILTSATELEKEFVNYILPDKLTGMNSTLMSKYLEFVCDTWLVELGCPKFYFSSQPFEFMNTIGQRRKDNFFEKSSANYSRDTTTKTLDFDLI